MYQNTIYICISWCSKSCCFPVKKCWRQQNSKCVSRDSNIFWIFFGEGITVPSLIIVGYVWQILGRGAFLPPSIREKPQKRPSWIGLKFILNIFCWSQDSVNTISWTIFSPYIKNLFLRLSAWDNELLSTPKIITFLAKLIPKFHRPALSNTIWYLLHR